MALLLSVLFAAQLSLKSAGRKLLLCLLVIPVAVIKNSIRIVTLSALAVYVNPEILQSRLHRNGGVLFFLLGFAVMMGLVQLS